MNNQVFKVEVSEVYLKLVFDLQGPYKAKMDPEFEPAFTVVEA